MSGGIFDYREYAIYEIIEKIEREIQKNGVKKSIKDLEYDSWKGDDWYINHPEELYHYKYPDYIITELKTTVDLLKRSVIYINRVDYLLSGDDSEETFISRLKNDLEKI